MEATKPYNKYIPVLVNFSFAHKIRITVYQAANQTWYIKNLIGY